MKSTCLEFNFATNLEKKKKGLPTPALLKMLGRTSMIWLDVFLVNRHFILLDNQHVQVAGTIHRVVQVKKSQMLVDGQLWE